MSYGIVWRDGDRPLASGKLEFLPRALHLDGMAGSEPAASVIPYDSLASVRVGRAREDRIDGRPAVVLERLAGPPVAVASVVQPGILAEIAERLAALKLGRTTRTAVVVPLREGAHAAVRELLANGPPFDPEQTGLDRHQVLLTAHEAIFLFESRLGDEALELLLSSPELWESAAAWRDHLAGPPRIAEDVYLWTRPERPDESLLPPGFRAGEEHMDF